MSAATNQKTFYINSSAAFRDPSGTNEDFTITTTTFRLASVPKRVKLINACIPYTWNNITDFNNTFTLIEPGVPASYIITVPDGHYDGFTLASILQTAIMAATPTLTYTVVFSSTTLKYTISATGTFQLDFTTSNSIAVQLGFNVDTITSPDTSTTSTDVAQLIPDYQIFICSDLVTGSDNGVMVWTPDPPSSSEVLASVPIAGCFGGIITYVTNGEPFFPISQSAFAQQKNPGDTSPRVMRYFLRFPSGIPVNLNGVHWTAQLVFEF